MKIGRTALISILLFILYFSGSAAAVLEDSGNVTAVAVGPAGEEIGGDPGITLLEVGAETAGIEHEDIGIVDDGVDGQKRKNQTKEKGGTADINIGVGEMQESSESESGGIGFGDGIKGARPPSESSSYKVVVRGWDPEKKKAASFAQYKQTDLDFILSRSSRTVGELEEYTRALAQSDPNIENIILTESTVALDYKYPAKLLWLVDVNYTMTATVDALGRVKVKLPWWLFLSKNNADNIAGELESALTPMGDAGQLANMDLQSAMQKQQQILQTISNVAKTKHDTARASIQNIR